MEKSIKIKSNDSYTIFGTLKSTQNSNQKLIVFVHGLYSDQNDEIYVNAANYFGKKNYDTFRFDLYSEKENARKLVESSITTHIKDIESVIKFFKNDYKELYLVGHSIGGLAIINSKYSIISKIVLWDPSAGLSLEEEKSDISYDEKTGLYIVDRGVKFQLNTQMITEWKQAKNIEDYINKIDNKTSFIFAENSSIRKRWKQFINSYKHTIIKQAGHTFKGEKIEKELFNKTLEYLED